MATKKRRLNGDGSFKKRPNGTWEYMIVVPGQYDSNGKPIRISAYGRTQAECREKARVKLNQYATGTVFSPDAVTVTQLAEQISRAKLDDGTTQQQSYDRDMETIKRLAPLGNIPMQKLTVAQLRDYCNSQRHYSDNTIIKAYQMLGRTYKEAVKRGIVQKNLMLEVKKPRSAKPKEDVRALTVDEEKRLIDVLLHEDIKYAEAMLVSVFTGMRCGEVLALQPRDIDYNEKIIHISKTVSRTISGSPYINQRTKTDAGARDLRINDDLCRFLRNITDGKAPDELLFAQHGKPVSTGTVNTHYTAALKRFEIIREVNGKKVTLHSLRHTYATRCIESGMQAKVLQHRLGHRDIQTTYNVYGDVFTAYEDDCLSAADEYMASKGLILE